MYYTYDKCRNWKFTHNGIYLPFIRKTVTTETALYVKQNVCLNTHAERTQLGFLQRAHYLLKQAASIVWKRDDAIRRVERCHVSKATIMILITWRSPEKTSLVSLSRRVCSRWEYQWSVPHSGRAYQKTPSQECHLRNSVAGRTSVVQGWWSYGKIIQTWFLLGAI